MKIYTALFMVAIAGTLAAQQATPASNTKTSAATPVVIEAPAHNISTVTSADNNALPTGTAIRMKLETRLSTDSNKRGDRFAGRVIEAVVLNGRTIIPAGSSLEGNIVRAESRRRIRGNATLDLNPDTVTLPDGQRFKISAAIVDTSDQSLSINDEGELKGQGHNRGDWFEMGAISAVGGGLGAAIGGGKGFLVGTTIGAGASAVHWLLKTRSAEVPAGTELVMELSRPMQLTLADGD